MSWPSIVRSRRGVVAVLGPVWIGCATGQGEWPGPVGEVLKVSYYRATPQPTYGAVMSHSWMQRIGESPQEPFPRAAPAPQRYLGFIDDEDLRGCFDELRRHDLLTLRASDPADYRPDDLVRKASDPKEAPYTRILTVGTDTWHLCFSFRDQQFSEQAVRTFLECERLVTKMVVHLRSSTDPFPLDTDP